MSELIETRQDEKRGCGWRKKGGLYLVLDGPAGSCGKLPVPLETCPTCHSGIKPTRGWTWVEAAPLLAAKECSKSMIEGADVSLDCLTCPLAGSTLGRVGLLWIGGKFYATPDDFNRESIAQGISRRISAVPKDFKVGETWVLLAHREALKKACHRCNGSGEITREAEAVKCNDCEGSGVMPQAAIFAVFKPSAIEYVVKGDETEDELKALRDRGITPVKVERVGSEANEDLHPKTSRGTKERPSAGSKTGRVWEIADSLCSNGNLPTRREVVLSAIAEGINEATAGTQYGRWLRSRAEKPMTQLRVDFTSSRRRPHKKREIVNDYVVLTGQAADTDDAEFDNKVKFAVYLKCPPEEGWNLDWYAPVVGEEGEVTSNG